MNKRSNLIARSLAVPLVVAAALGLSGCAESAAVGAQPSTQASANQTASVEHEDQAATSDKEAKPVVGKPFLVDMGRGDEARITVKSAEFVKTVSDNDYADRPETGSFIRMDILWETTAGETATNPFYFTAKDADGRNLNAAIMIDGALGTGEIPVGDKSRGYIAFDAAKGPVTLSISNKGMQEAARITVDAK